MGLFPLSVDKFFLSKHCFTSNKTKQNLFIYLQHFILLIENFYMIYFFANFGTKSSLRLVSLFNSLIAFRATFILGICVRPLCIMGLPYNLALVHILKFGLPLMYV